ncbi:hypothetical protein SEMRO_588_G171420.1 [Seminavis robusta]|uniref:Uncharacterized protein n=1 Tax=Seminavis robusta TaxID=568900 RepID=A0A9N8E630_9STRA|nr:hypothetical protein SEMRO_588_G171420.1 [Seminavis robusta]|eukprot:Sro588_g171420.1 n/a (288) ;mRNA; r:361-1224
MSPTFSPCKRSTPSPNQDGMFGFFTQEQLPPTPPLKPKGKPKDDRLYETPDKENREPQKQHSRAAKRPPLTPEPAGLPPTKINNAPVPSIEKQIQQQLANQDAAGHYTGGRMEPGESPYMFLLADVFITSKTKTHRLGFWRPKKESPNDSVLSYNSQNELYDTSVDRNSLKKWLIEESEMNAEIMARMGAPTPQKAKKPQAQTGSEIKPKKKMPKGGKAKVDAIMRSVRQSVTDQFIANPRMMELKEEDVASRIAQLALEISGEAAALPSAVNHARNAAKKKNPQDV